MRGIVEVILSAISATIEDIANEVIKLCENLHIVLFLGLCFLFGLTIGMMIVG